MRIAAVVPARDEAERIGATIQALHATTLFDEIVVSDDGSVDGTAELAEKAGVRVIRSHRSRGKGAALAAGSAATDAAVLVFVDADLRSSAGGVGVLVEPVRSGSLDMAIAAPPPSAPSGLGLVEGLARWSIRRTTGAVMARPLSGQRALRRDVLERVRWPVAGFGVEVALTIDAIRAGFRVAEVPMPVEHRRTGRDLAGFAHRARQGVAVMRVSAARGVRFRPR